MLSVIGSVLGGFKRTIRGLFFSPGFPRCAMFVAAEGDSGQNLMTGDNPVRSSSKEGVISRLRFVACEPTAVGESMTVDVLRSVAGSGVDFESILTAPYVLAAESGAGVYDFTSLLISGTLLGPADVLAVNQTYVAGDAPTLENFGTFVDYYGDSQP